jgi:NAD(P)H dehydrogenase (quinone)
MAIPKILVTAAAGKTGSATAVQLLGQGYPVRAMVRAHDHRSETLRRAGAEIVVGNLDDIVDVRQAVDGVQRAYFCPPVAPGSLGMSMIFAAAAQEHKLEAVTVMSQWLADPTNPSTHTREVWLADTLFAWMPDVATVTINPGWFADNYRTAGLDVIAQLGVMMLPLGDGLNAPPSNEDMARVIVGTLTNPAPHVGKTYRPTGPRLLSPYEIAETFGKVLGRNVRYQDAPLWMFPKAARAFGVPDFQAAQLLTYFEEYRRNSFAIGAPTGAVLEVTGQEPEDFETIARRYVAGPMMQRSAGALAQTLRYLVKVMVSPALDVDKFNRAHDLPAIGHARLAVDAPDWCQTHGGAVVDSRMPELMVAHPAAS